MRVSESESGAKRGCNAQEKETPTLDIETGFFIDLIELLCTRFTLLVFKNLVKTSRADFNFKLHN